MTKFQLKKKDKTEFSFEELSKMNSNEFYFFFKNLTKF